jgi:hypothetical protein
MGIIGKIFSADKLVESVGNGVDKFFDGNGDKAQRFERLLGLYEPFKLAQRILALMFSGVYLLSHVLALAVMFFKPELSAIIWERSNDNLLYIVLSIITFYFAGGVVNPALKRMQKRAN